MLDPNEAAAIAEQFGVARSQVRRDTRLHSTATEALNEVRQAWSIASGTQSSD